MPLYFEIPGHGDNKAWTLLASTYLDGIDYGSDGASAVLL